jgi:AcrR family transcriptional regulator
MASYDDTGLPASIEAAWGRRARPTKGPRPGLSLEQIVDAAVGLAVSEGIGAVSMARVAGELGSSPMSLYRYVAAKDELLALMIDAALGSPPAAAAGEGWREGLSRWAWAYHDVLRRHPWSLQVPIAGPAVTPNLTAWLEDGLRSLGDTGLPEAEKLSVMLLLSGYVRNAATLEASMSAAEAGEIMPTWGRLLARLTDPEDFPALHAALGSEAFAQDDDPDDEFVFGLERVLDGIAALVEARG